MSFIDRFKNNPDNNTNIQHTEGTKVQFDLIQDLDAPKPITYDHTTYAALCQAICALKKLPEAMSRIHEVQVLEKLCAQYKALRPVDKYEFLVEAADETLNIHLADKLRALHRELRTKEKMS